MEIAKASLEDLNAVMDLFSSARDHLRSRGIYQWDEYYPNVFVIQQDLENGELYCVFDNARLVAAITLNEQAPTEYSTINWEHTRALVIHRLVVDPNMQGRGIGKKLVQFAVECARQRRYPSIHLDAYSGNQTAVNLYERNGYTCIGEVYFPLRELPYMCYEKAV